MDDRELGIRQAAIKAAADVTVAWINYAAAKNDLLSIDVTDDDTGEVATEYDADAVLIMLGRTIAMSLHTAVNADAINSEVQLSD